MALNAAQWKPLSQRLHEALASFHVEHNTSKAQRRIRICFRDNNEPPWNAVERSKLQLCVTQSRELYNLLSKIDAEYKTELDMRRKDLMADVLQLPTESEFRGDAHDRLFDHVFACWDTFCSTRPSFRTWFPYIAMIQSSGFGKTRMLRELATRSVAFNRDEAVNNKRLHVMYVCPSATGFSPRPTPLLWRFLFVDTPSTSLKDELAETLSARLVIAFKYVMVHKPDAVATSEELLELCTTNERDSNERDDTLATAMMDCGGKLLESSRTRSTPQEKELKLLVLAVDEAARLVPEQQNESSTSWLYLFRMALYKANRKIYSEFGRECGIFGILTGTTTALSSGQLTRVSLPMHESQLVDTFDPFVVTDNIDIFKSQHESEAFTDWASLRYLGRPLWASLDRRGRSQLTKIAASRLLGITSMSATLGPIPRISLESLHARSMFGVAAVLCRVGLRPISSSPFASRAVADFMAVLSYVSYKRDRVVCSYSSDPILTLGATRLWHEWGKTVLAEKMLPQLRLLLSDEMLRVDGGVDAIVARIVLLLVMDACGALKTGRDASRWEEAGEFCSVWSFLRVIHGDEPTQRKPIPRGDSGSQTKRCKPTPLDSEHGSLAKALETKWKHWHVCFTHFVELPSLPSTAACLWSMLRRRAAGIVVSENRVTTLVIPIYYSIPEDTSGAAPSASASTSFETRERVSMILVNVLSSKKIDVEDVAEHGRSDAAADDVNADDVLWIAMNFRGSQGSTSSFYVDCGKTRDGDSQYVLCVDGLAPWSTSVVIVSDKTAEALQAILNPLSNVMDLITHDRRPTMPWDDDDDESKSDDSTEVRMRVAKRPLAEALLVNY